MTSTSVEMDVPSDALALVHEGHRAAIALHPEWHAVVRTNSPASQLAWMVRRHLLTYDDLDDLMSFDEYPLAVDRIVEDAFAELSQSN